MLSSFRPSFGYPPEEEGESVQDTSWTGLITSAVEHDEFRGLADRVDRLVQPGQFAALLDTLAAVYRPLCGVRLTEKITADFCNGLGVIFMFNEQYRSAVAPFAAACSISYRYDNPDGIIANLANQAEAYLALGERPDAFVLLRRAALEVSRLDSLFTPQSEFVVASLGELEDLPALADSVLAWNRPQGDLRAGQRARLHFLFGLAFMTTEDFERAGREFGQAVELFSRAADTLAEITARYVSINASLDPETPDRKRAASDIARILVLMVRTGHGRETDRVISAAQEFYTGLGEEAASAREIRETVRLDPGADPGTVAEISLLLAASPSVTIETPERINLLRACLVDRHLSANNRIACHLWLMENFGASEETDSVRSHFLNGLALALEQRDWPSLTALSDLDQEDNIYTDVVDSMILNADDWSRAALCLLWRNDPDTALVLFEKTGDKAGQSRALNQQGLWAAEEGLPGKAEQTLWMAFDRAGEAGDTAAVNAAFRSAVSKFYDPMSYLLERDPAARTDGQLTVPQLLTTAGQLDTAAQQYLEEADYHFEQVETLCLKLKDLQAADIALLRSRLYAPAAIADSVPDSVLWRDRRNDRELLVMYLDRAANAGYYTGTDGWCDNFLEELRGCAELGWAGILRYGANRQYRSCRRVLRDRIAKLDPQRKRNEYLSAGRELLVAYAGLQAAPDAAAELERIQALFQGRAYRGLDKDQRQAFYEAAAVALGGDTLRSAQLVRFDWVGFGNRSYRITGQGGGSASYIIEDIIYKPDVKFEISGNLLAPRLAARTRFDYLPVRAPGWRLRDLEKVCELAGRWRRDLPWTEGTGLRLAFLETSLRIELGQFLTLDTMSLNPAPDDDPWARSVQAMLRAEVDDHFGRFKNSLDGFDRAGKAAEKIADNLYLRGCVEGGAGNVCLALSDTGQARIRFGRVDKLIKGRKDLKSLAARLAISQGNLELLNAGMSGSTKSLAQARGKFDQAVRLGSDHEDPSVILGARIDRAIVDHLLGQTPAAREEIGRIVEDARREERPELEASALMVDALLALAAADYDRARKSAEAGVVFYRESGDRYALSNALGLLGIAFKRLSQPESALVKLAESVDLFETMRREAGGDALESFTEANLDRYGEIVDLLAKLGRAEEAFGYVERCQAKSLMEAFDLTKIAPADSNLGSSLKRAQELRSEVREAEDNLAAEFGQDPDDRDPKAASRHDSTLAHTKSEFLSVESDIRRLNPDYEALIRVTPGQLAKLQRILPASAAVIEYYSSASALYVFEITSDSFRCRSVAVSRDSLYDLAKKYRAIMRETAVSVGAGLGADPIPAWRDDGTKRYRETIRPIKDVSAALYQILLASVADDLKGRDDAVIVPTGMLAYLPFHALGHETDGEWIFFIQEKNVSYLTSSELLDIVGLSDDIVKPASLLGFGDPDGTLPSAEKEIEALKAVLPKVTVFTSSEATKDRAIALAPDYNVLHCATHARLDTRDPEESYILLAPGKAADGRWYMREIFGATWDQMKLVVLSACETALGEKDPGREVSALSYAFSVAGAPSIVASLWPVYDPSTMSLMTEFYRRLPNASRTASLRQAQLSVLKDPKTAHPFFWAPFVLIGDWR